MNILAIRYRNWSDRQLRFLFLTFGFDWRNRPFTFVLDSGCDEYSGCNLRVSMAGLTVICELPKIIRPWREKVNAVGWDKATIERLGRDWYYNEYPREFGFNVNDGFLQIFYGRQTHDSSTDKTWCYFIPWMQWRFIRQSWYGLDGEHLGTEYERARIGDWMERQKFIDSIPKAKFLFKDYDGKEITATTHIEEREWRFGEGWFKWLSLFRRRKISRRLAIDFNDEVGPEKGSWKGGTVGTSIEMVPSELHESAFKRYCEKEHRSKSRKYTITYIGPSGLL